MLFLDYQDRRPIYEQIVEKFRMLILSGAVEPSSKMPSVRQLAVELSINPNTIQRAYMDNSTASCRTDGILEDGSTAPDRISIRNFSTICS